MENLGFDPSEHSQARATAGYLHSDHLVGFTAFKMSAPLITNRRDLAASIIDGHGDAIGLDLGWGFGSSGSSPFPGAAGNQLNKISSKYTFELTGCSLNNTWIFYDNRFVTIVLGPKS
ncbi:unnamed protein product [Rhizoctonia solani]|uniref:Uncharacterized protein n=1 Tax=Rhizoctonia solani TaxID=456999 RepID=A0A8H3GKW5_9AGAM|nr:unnamed protein product [Rhizoctonia solani]CAE6517136.1 unnamed protein product [Rhizoctonia solani]